MNVLFALISAVGIAVLVIYVVVTGIGGIIELLYNSHIPLPGRFVAYVRQRRVQEAVSLLEELSVLTKIQHQQQAAIFSTIPPSMGRDLYEKDIIEVARAYLLQEDIRVGRVRDKQFPYFIDFMSATTDPRNLERLSRALASFMKDELSRLQDDGAIVFNVLVGMKGGSPSLGLATSRILGIPCTLHRQDSKIAIPSRPEFFFDGKVAKGDAVVLLDDSTTGGRMFSEATEHIRAVGAQVHHAFVLFEPGGGTARDVLGRMGVTLHSAVVVDEDFLKKLRND